MSPNSVFQCLHKIYLNKCSIHVLKVRQFHSNRQENGEKDCIVLPCISPYSSQVISFYFNKYYNLLTLHTQQVLQNFKMKERQFEDKPPGGRKLKRSCQGFAV